MIELLASIFVLIGSLFFITGSIGLLRLPDIYSRLHALTKADNLGLGLLLLGNMLLISDFITAAKLFLLWLFVVVASAVSTQLIAEHARQQEEES